MFLEDLVLLVCKFVPSIPGLQFVSIIFLFTLFLFHTFYLDMHLLFIPIFCIFPLLLPRCQLWFIL